MLDIKFIRDNPDLVRENLKKRNDPSNLKMLDELILLDKKWRANVTKVSELRRRRNEISIEIAKLKKEKKDAKHLLKEADETAEEIKKLDVDTEKLQHKTKEILLTLPNLLHESVPLGRDEHENVEVKRWGKPPKFDFTPKSHAEIALDLGLADFERGAKVAGAGFYYLKNELALLDMAIQRFAVDHLRKKGYQFIEPPYMITRKAYEGVIAPSDFETVTYKIEGEDLYMIATAEHPLGAMMMDEVIELKDLPLKFVGFSSCYRKEIGAHGKYTKGIFRVHQFNKVEQFIFCKPEDSWELHEELQRNAEELYEALGLHYRVMNVCTGDIGTIAAKKYDIDCWMADGTFRETGSNSNCTDYQARRLNVKYREGEGKAPIGFVHTLNNTALATSRTMIAILEQFQQKDGSVKIPKALVPWMGGVEKLVRN
ncbi:serine--tRNA ligase [Candidatus Micrarchaeota archaeon]|nr:serine--tRNA ligase [Candidatus Micrarchaeota archaeon]